jgi:hypothetical protein
MERHRPNRELKISEDVQEALIEGYFRYNHLSRMEADDKLLLDGSESGQYGKYPYRAGFCRIGPMKVCILY